MKITQIHIKNIGVFNDIIFDFPTSTGTNIHILTGPNGCGKTTTLLLIAGLFMGSTRHRQNKDSANFLKKRVRYFECDKNGEYKSYADFSFEDNSSKVKLRGCNHCKNLHTLDHSNIKVEKYNSMLGSSGKYSEKFDFAVFAYSGYRYIESQEINTLSYDKNYDALENSLDFIKNYETNSYSILQWIANTAAKYFIAKGKGEKDAEKYKEAISTIELILKEITGKKIEFEISLEPVEVYLKIDDAPYDFDVLPDGLRSLISWIADLLMRLDRLPWKDNLPILERNIILLLDEIESHLHPKWQRKVLPVVQRLFKNAQIFVSTHSPFVVNSIDGAFIHKIQLENGVATVLKPEISSTALSIETILDSVFEAGEDFGLETQYKLDLFYKYRTEIMQNDTSHEIQFIELAKTLAMESVEIKDIIQFEIRQLNKVKEKVYSI